MQIDILFGLIILIVSTVLHEVAHGYMANWLGDPTARLQGRLTLNPVSHIDPIGSIVLPLFLVLGHSPFLIGYAKPVPYNPYNLRGRYAEGLVAFAGPGTNFLLAIIFGLAIRLTGPALPPDMQNAFALITYINLMLGLFNLIPIPPLDGSKVLSSIFAMISTKLESAYDMFRANFERLGVLSGTLLILIIFYFLGSTFFVSILQPLYQLLTGVSL